MRLNVSTSIDVAAREKAGDNLLFLGFHGFSNDENDSDEPIIQRRNR